MNAILNYMKKNFKVILAILAISVALWSFMPKKSSDPEKDKNLLDLITFIIEKAHYDPAAIDDNFSKAVYKDYLEALDPSKRFFLQSDIDEFKTYEFKIDDMLHNRDLAFFTLTYERIKKRMNEAKVVFKALNDKPYDFSTDETINIDSEKNVFANDYADLKARWRLQMKLSVLATVVDKQKVEADKKEKDPKYVAKEFAQLEKEARESTQKSLNDYFTFVEELQREDWFEVFVNSIVMQFDPHTYYFAPTEKDRFDQSMSGKLEGIGARLQRNNGVTEVSELISGGPAWRGRELDPGDQIIKVAQGKDEPVDVVGMKLDDVVKKIKGPKGTEVRLTVKKADGSIKIVSIIRDIVEIEETYAKSSIVEKKGMKYGVIYLPKFYIDFENNDSRDSAKDIAIEIDRLKKEGVQGIVMDLRDNGGGSLKTVVDIAGLFIEEGPIVQTRDRKNIEVLYDHDPKVQWDGPLVVMINNFSASASEIFAAAIQDYKRGIIIGSKQSYGKGTVQTVADLNQYVPKPNLYGDFGALKITTQKFYRINGGSTQLEGVASDVAIPDRYSYIKIGERDVEKAMPWDKIEQAPYRIQKPVSNFETLVANSKKRVAENPQFKLIDENAKWINDRKEDDVVSLNINKFKAEQAQREEETKKFKAITKFENQLVFNSLSPELELIKKDSTLGRKRKDWHENLAKDAYIEEALNVLGDMVPAAVVNKKVAFKNKL
jgi:carboxyl-terminal processing protease